VPKLLALAELFGNPESYSFDLASIPDAPAITQVDIGSQIEIAKAAELADLSTEEFYRLNPAFNRWATDPDGPHQLLLPVDKVDDFTARLSSLDPDDRVTWARHTVQRGETLGHIAKRYGVSVSVLKQINDLNGHVVRAGANLIVPSGGRPQPTAVAATGSSSAAAEPKRITHVVRNGDTLWTISRSHGIDMEKLAEWNTLSPDDILRPGQRLIIWKTEPVASNESDGYQLAGPALPVRDMIRRINYVVRRGDSLTRISQRFNVSVADLRKWNSLGRKHALRPGQSLTLYVDVTRQTANL
jgi:membrane-bound lytic murein transglycosylase D